MGGAEGTAAQPEGQPAGGAHRGPPHRLRQFQGDIPAGEYGGGKVRLWDRGRYELEKWTDREVKVVFHGTRAPGRYVLFQTRGRDWMVHRMDPPPFADWQPVPVGLRPMTAASGPLPAGGRRRWSYELAWGGVRALVAVEGGRTKVTDADGGSIAPGYPELRPMGPALGSRVCLFDGEIVALGADGHPDPGLLDRRPPGPTAPGRRNAREAPVTYLVFDLLHLDGVDTTALPYRDRRALLKSLGLQGAHWRVMPTTSRTGADLLRAARNVGAAGVVAKRWDRSLRGGRPRSGPSFVTRL